MYSFDDPSYLSLGGLDSIVSDVTGGSSGFGGGSSFYDPSYFDLNTLTGATPGPLGSGAGPLSSFVDYPSMSQPDFAKLGMVSGGTGEAPSTASKAGSLLSGIVGELGGWGGVATLGLGGLSQYLNMRGQDRDRELKERALEAEIAKAEGQQAMKEGAFGDDFAKMHALAQIIQDRQGINLDPSLAYAQALRRKYGVSPDNANDFPGIDIGGPMRVGMSSPERLEAINESAGVNLRNGGLGLLRGGTSGQADQINARLSDGEYVFDADVVAALGDGNTEAGARKLDQMREQVRRHKRGASHKSIPPAAKNPMQYMKG